VDSVLRAFVVYIVLLVILRVAGSRTMAEITTFDFVLILIISEAVQQAMIDDDNSMIQADVLEAARELQGVSTFEQIDYAVLEKNGHVTVIPKKGKGG
jgi:uncharacterized membrane protein YcaP (DUF421 family)